MTDPLLPSPPSLLKQAIKAVPAVKWALGVGGIIALIAIVSSFGIGFKVAVLGSVVMFVLMAMLVVFGSLAGQKSSSFHMPALVFTWFSLILVMATASALFIAVFWGNPEEIRARLGIQSAPLPTTNPRPPSQATAPVSVLTTAPATIPAAVSARTTPKKVSPSTSEPSTSRTAAKGLCTTEKLDPQGYYNLGKTWNDLKQYDQAITYFECGESAFLKMENERQEGGRETHAFLILDWGNAERGKALSSRKRKDWCAAKDKFQQAQSLFDFDPIKNKPEVMNALPTIQANLVEAQQACK